MPLLPRGGGTSQSGQTVGRALVIDFTQAPERGWSRSIARRGTCLVEPGIVLDELNRQLKVDRAVVPGRRVDVEPRDDRRHDRQQLLRHPLDPLRHHARQRASPSTRCWPTARQARFGEVGSGGARVRARWQLRRCWPAISSALGAREAEHIRGAFPEVSRRVGGYLIDALLPRNAPVNLATLLCGSEGTLALSRAHRAEALAAAEEQGARHLPLPDLPRRRWRRRSTSSSSAPVAVEVVDRTLIELARDIAMFRPVMEALRARQAGRAAARRVRGGRSGREPAPPRPARRADGRPRPSRQRW